MAESKVPILEERFTEHFKIIELLDVGETYVFDREDVNLVSLCHGIRNKYSSAGVWKDFEFRTTVGNDTLIVTRLK
jgi:hypothetical protein